MSPDLQQMIEKERGNQRAGSPSSSLDQDIAAERRQSVEGAQGNFNVTRDTSPDDAGKVVSLAERYGVDYGFARDNRETIERDAEEEDRRILLETAPAAVRDFFRADPARAAVASDSVEYYSRIAKLTQRPQKPGLLSQGAAQVGDFFRSIGAGGVSMFAGAASGTGEMLDTAVDLNMRYGLGNIPGVRQAADAEQRLYEENPAVGRTVNAVLPSNVLKAYGENARGVADTYRPDSQGIEDQIGEGLGQIVAAVMLGAAGGTRAATGVFMGMGADQQAQRMRSLGIDPSDKPGQLFAGAGATGALESLRLGSILRVLPPAARAKAANTMFSRIIGQGIEEAGQEATEAITQNLIASSYDAEARLFEGVAQEAGTAGAAAAIFQTLVEVALPGRQRAASAEQYAERQRQVREQVEQAPVFQRRRQDVETLIEEASEGDTAFLDGEGLVQLYQADGTFGRIVREDLGLTDEDIERAYNGSDIEVPLSKIQTVRDQFEPILDIIRSNPDAMSMREVREQAETDAMSVDMDALRRELEDEQQEVEGFERVQGAVTEQLVQTGRSVEEAEAAGVLWGAFFRRLAADGIDEGKVFDQLKLRIEGEQGKDAVQAPPEEVLTQAADAGYQGENRGEAAEWLAATAKGLDMSQEARMARAREMGFDTQTVLYHGTVREGWNDTTDITAFDRSRTGDRWSADNEGFFFTNRARTANFYGGRTRPSFDLADFGDPVVYPVYVQNENILEAQAPQHTDDVIAYWDSTLSNGLREKAKRQGASGIRITQSDGEALTVIFDPSNIRSVNAAFDPDNADSANLLAQSAPLATGAQTIEMGRASATVTVTDNGYAELNMLRVPEEARGQGEAAALLDSVIERADAQGLTLHLTPEAVGQGGMTDAQLRKFYSSRGFAPNKGRNKDFTVRSAMIRPAKLAQPDGSAGSAPRATVQIPGVLTQLPGAQILEDEAIVVRLSKAADKTSFLHETAHIFLELYAALESENAAVAERMADIRTWLKLKPGEKLTRDQHELFAESFEVYLMDGKAPTKELRQTFRAFKAWFTAVYRRLRDRLPKLNPRAKAVFNRMLATEDDISIARAETTMGLRQFLRDIMSEEQIARYEDFARKAGDVAREKLFKKHVAEIRRRDSKAYREDKAAIRAELKDAYEQEGVYRARAELTDDGKTIREGVDADMVAPDYGFVSGDAMIEAVRKAPSLERTLDIETKRKLDSLYGDMLTDGTAEEEAIEAVFNEQSVKSLEVERDAIASQMAKQRSPDKKRGLASEAIPLNQIKAYAQQQIDSQPVSKIIQPGRYAIKARDLHKKSLRAAAVGKWEDALRYTHQAMLHHELARRAYKARDEFETIRRVLKPYRPSAFPKKDTHKKMDPPFISAIRTLMALPGSDGQFEGMANLREFRDKQAAEGIAVQIPVMVENDQPLPDMRNMTMDQLRDFRDSVRQMGRQGRANSEAERAAFTADVEKLADEIRRNYTGKVKRETRNPKAMERVGRSWRNLEALFLRYPFLVEALQGGKNGAVVEALEQGLRRQLTLRNERRREMGEKLVEILDRHGITQTELKKRIEAPSIEAGSVKFEQVLAVALNMGTQSNRDRLAADPSLGDMEQLEALVADKLEQRHWDAAQDIWDLIGSLWPEAKAVEQRVTGSVPQKVESTPVQTRFGTYAGGYFPLSYDRDFLSNRDLEQQDMKDLWSQAVNGMATGAATEKGFLKERKEGVKRPLKLGLDTIVEHIDDVTNDIYMREETIQISRILRHPAFASAMADTHGKEYQKTLETVVKRVVHGTERPADSVEKLFRTLRVNASVAILGYNVKTALLAPVSYLQTVVPRYGPKVVLDGLRAFYSHGFNAQKFIMDKSAFMRERVDTLSREAHERVRQAKGQSRWNRVQGAGYWMMSFVEIWSTSGPTWMGVYRDALAKGKSEADAITDADRAVATTQGSGLEIDQSILQGGGEFQRALTFMWGYVSGYYGIVRNDIAKAKGYEKAWPVVKHLLILNIAASMMEAFLRMTPADDDEDPYLQAVGEVYWRNLVGMIPGVSLAWNRYGGEAPAIQAGQGIADSFRAWARVKDDIAETGELEGETVYKATRQTLKSAGIAAGVPGTVQIDKAINTIVVDDDPNAYEIFMSGPDDDN